jgi:prepilin-type N-terminal cleavage/methylation domain-containing protein
MTTSIPLTDRGRALRAFTLTEVIIASTIGSVIMLGVLTTFLMLGRSAANLVNYNELDTEARRALELFSEDVRMAKEVNWNGVSPSSATSVTLTIPPVAAAGSDILVTYFWDTLVGADTYQCFCRRIGTPPPSTQMSNRGTVLVRNVTTFQFNAFKIGGSGPASNALETKQIQLSLTASRSSRTAVTATDMVLSARFILRNKRSST